MKQVNNKLPSITNSLRECTKSNVQEIQFNFIWLSFIFNLETYFSELMGEKNRKVNTHKVKHNLHSSGTSFFPVPSLSHATPGCEHVRWKKIRYLIFGHWSTHSSPVDIYFSCLFTSIRLLLLCFQTWVIAIFSKAVCSTACLALPSSQGSCKEAECMY